MAGVQQNQFILLVEEEHEIALSSKLQLELNGFKVKMFTDPFLALDEYKKNPLEYSLVISDMKMVSMSTFEFMRAVKTENSNSKILLITPFEIKLNEFSRVLPTSKVNGFIEKTFLTTRLITSVHEILDPRDHEILKP